MPDELVRPAALALLIASLGCGPDKVDPEILDVRMDGVPASVSLQRDTAITVIVTARNTLQERVRVKLQVLPRGLPHASTGGSAADTYRTEFGVRVAHRPDSVKVVSTTTNSDYGPFVVSLGRSGFVATTAHRALVAFGPGETLSEGFQVRLDSAVPGTYVLVGSFATREARPVTLRVTP